MHPAGYGAVHPDFGTGDGDACLAETSSITYEGDINDGHFTFAPGTTYSPTDMFLAMKDMMPGDVRTQRIQVSNQAQGHVQLVLYVRSSWNSNGGSQALKDVMSVTYTADGNAAQFEAADHAPELPDGWVLVGELNTTNSQATDVSIHAQHLLDTRAKLNAILAKNTSKSI